MWGALCPPFFSSGYQNYCFQALLFSVSENRVREETLGMKMDHRHWLPNNERDALLGRRTRDAISGGVYALIIA